MTRLPDSLIAIPKFPTCALELFAGFCSYPDIKEHSRLCSERRTRLVIDSLVPEGRAVGSEAVVKGGMDGVGGVVG